MSIDKLKTKFFTGSFVNDVKHYFTKINEIIDWINNIGTPSYKSYVGLVTQTGTNAPTATILQNTIGTVTYTYSGVGIYHATSSGLFTENKTFFIMSSSNYGSDGIIFTIDWVSSSDITINCFDTAAHTSLNDALLKSPIEIRVYN